MKCSQRLSLVAIGDEILCGHTLNTNAATVALACAKIGRTPDAHSVVGDDPAEMEKILCRELLLGGDVITFGGLGPTCDDLTREIVAKIFKTPLIIRNEYALELEQRYGKPFPSIKNQSMQPEKAILLKNSVGTAPGLFLEDATLFPGARLFVLPGPPHELKDVFEKGVLPLLGKGKSIASSWLTFIGASEWDVNTNIVSLLKDFPSLKCGIYPSYESVSVHLYHEDEALLHQARAKFLDIFHGTLLPEKIPSLEEYCVLLLKERGWTLATAESCTGGAIASRICSVNGASDVFLGSVVAYKESIKQNVLAVSDALLETYGVVSQEVTLQMAKGVKSLTGADVAIAVSGYFGPTGGTKKAPLGTVSATILFPEKTIAQTFFFQGTRSSICAQTVGALLGLMCEGARL